MRYQSGQGALPWPARGYGGRAPAPQGGGQGLAGRPGETFRRPAGTFRSALRSAQAPLCSDALSRQYKMAGGLIHEQEPHEAQRSSQGQHLRVLGDFPANLWARHFKSMSWSRCKQRSSLPPFIFEQLKIVFERLCCTTCSKVGTPARSRRNSILGIHARAQSCLCLLACLLAWALNETTCQKASSPKRRLVSSTCIDVLS